jgi:hypothetical protein
LKKELLPETKIGALLSVRYHLDGDKIRLYIISDDVSTSYAFKFDEWEKFVETTNRANDFLRIFAGYKDKHYDAIILAQEISSEARKAVNWSPKVIFNGKEYSSPSAAAKRAKDGKETNGWTFWKYKDPTTGQVCRLDNLRNKEQRNHRKKWWVS